MSQPGRCYLLEDVRLLDEILPREEEVGVEGLLEDVD